MTTLYLMRHGQYSSPDGIVPYRLPGFHLSQEGRKQAQKAAKKLGNEPLVAVYTSPLERTMETAAIVAAPHNLRPIVDERLIETRSPAQGLTLEQIEKHGPFDWSMFESDWYKQERAEMPDQILFRLNDIIDEKIRVHQGKAFMCVTHGDLVMLASSYYHDGKYDTKTMLARPYVGMAAMYKIQFDDIGTSTVSTV